MNKADDQNNNIPDLVPARMLNEFAYCPRLCYIEWVQGDFRDNVDTVDGRYKHRRVDQQKGKLPENQKGEEAEEIHTTSVHISGRGIGITTRIDLLEGDAGRVFPVDYKRGEAPDLPQGAYEPERVQLCAQGLVLRENGFQCDEGIIYFAQSKKRVSIQFDRDLIQRTKTLLKGMRGMARKGEMPPPLEDSPKCPRCSLVGICLPDEINLLRGRGKQIRKLYPSRDDTTPVYVVGYGHSVHKKGNRLEIRKKDDKVRDIPLREVSQLCVYGNVYITIPVLRRLMQMGVPVCYFSHGGWFYGFSQGIPHKNVELRITQHRTAEDRKASLMLARKFVEGKIKNSRTMIRRNDPQAPDAVLDHMELLAEKAKKAPDKGSLLGFEGAAAQTYFSRFNYLLKTGEEIHFQERNKRPPEDPVNAVLSYLYGVLTKEWFVTLLAAGFDPYRGFFHQPKYGRPALALDLMEEFRPLIADSVTISLFNNGELGEEDFVKAGKAITLKPRAKKKVITGYERRLNTEITHPIFGYTISYRRILEVQARLLSRTLTKELETYPPFCTR